MSSGLRLSLSNKKISIQIENTRKRYLACFSVSSSGNCEIDLIVVPSWATG
uniref:Uncharacterized protein n=1 Tax=Utricularia reniformis TaxID=192314 RepID=A0A1Y0B4G8_9LAMI|nr:hypothetical protein AEK19_MT2139 [Utricularia reniformis]ART32290.1 hypothetical protein AEK19_MT2139 [Utricularia reniformis]